MLGQKLLHLLYWGLLGLGMAGAAKCAAPGDTPLMFFTNVAERLLKTKLDQSLTHIEVYPSNQYSLASHRLLQVAANLAEASRSSFGGGDTGFPFVFRPLLCNNDTNVWLCGYTNESSADAIWSWFDQMPDGIPLVVGAKNGLPNLNEFVFQTAFDFTRRLEVGRPSLFALPDQTNQLLLLSISNVFGVETWNSYSTPFSNDFQVLVTNALSLTLSNAVDGYVTNPPPYRVGAAVSVLASTNGNWHWHSTSPATSGYAGGFMVPLYTNITLLSRSRFMTSGLDLYTDSFAPRTGTFPAPDWQLSISNRLTYVMSSGGAILDAVALSFYTNLNVTAMLLTEDPVYPAVISALWDTNRNGVADNPATPTEGILRQIAISMGNPTLSASDWASFNGSQVSAQDKDNAIQYFTQFVSMSNFTPTNLYAQAPFTASRRFVHTISWQANDPLVHYMLQDLSLGPTNSLRFIRPNDIFTNNLNLGRLNLAFRPWFGSPLISSEDSAADDTYIGIKDAGVFCSDNWDFPTNLVEKPGLIGRVHRGTPWQTIYLKSEVASPSRWMKVSSDPRTQPTNDWSIASTFLALCQTNHPANLFSINQQSLAAWQGILGGLTVLSNSSPLFERSPNTNFDVLVMAPNSPQAEVIAESIALARFSRVPAYFEQIGDVLAAPELTASSPWLDRSDLDLLQFSVTDEAYEKIPEQLLPLLRADPILSINRADQQIQLTASVFAGYWYALEASCDLNTWTSLQNLFADGDSLEFTSLSGTEPPKRFYRLRLVAGP